MRWGVGRSESLCWKKHTLLFHCSGALEEHGSSSGGLNKDANFIPSSAVNIKKRYGVCRRTVTLFQRELVCLCSCYSSPHSHNFETPSLSVWYGRMSVVFLTPSRKRGGFGTCHLHNDHKLSTMGFFTSVKRKHPFPSFFNKKEWNK